MPVAVRHLHADAGELHRRELPTAPVPELWVMHPIGPALVMGSAQREAEFDVDRLAVDEVALAGRRSGGGAVFIEPHATVWIDVLVPRGWRSWADDLASTFVAVGEIWQRALAGLGIDTVVRREAPARSEVATAACWASLGWGELTIGPAKLLGLSQRRTRWGARVQAMAVLDESAARVADYLREPPPGLADAIATGHAASLAGAGVTAARLQRAALEALDAALA